MKKMNNELKSKLIQYFTSNSFGVPVGSSITTVVDLDDIVDYIENFEDYDN